jgi:hypothetical protein
VTYTRAGGRRLHPGSATEDIVMPLSTVTPTGGMYQAWASPMISWTDAGGPHSANFAFWAVTGAADGPSMSVHQSLSVTVGATDVQAVAWYLPTGGSGNGDGRALYIDAFDVNEGRFFDEDFVSVTSNPALSANANETGVVPTTSAADVQAFGSVAGVPFLDWTEFVQPDPLVVTSQNLHADAGTNVIAFAFYQTPVTTRPPIGSVVVPSEGTWVSWGVMVDGGGPTGHGPVGPWDPFVRQLAVGLALAEASQMVDDSLRAEVGKIAATQVQLAARNITGAIQKGIG